MEAIVERRAGIRFGQATLAVTVMVARQSTHTQDHADVSYYHLLSGRVTRLGC
jgi:hypothetical protein